MGKKGGGGAPPVDPNVGLAQLKMSQLAESQWADWQNNIFPWLKSEQEKANQLLQSENDRQHAFNLEERDYFRQQQAKQDAIADEYYARMRDKFYPIEDSLIDQANTYDTAANRERLARDAMGDVASQFGNARQAEMMRQQAFGIDPTSGAAAGQGNMLGIQEATAQAAAATRARDAAEQLGWAKKMDVAAMGKGLVGAQASSVGLGLQAGGMGNAAGNTAFGNSMQAGQAQLGNAMGMGNMQMGAYGQNAGMWGNLGNLSMQRSNYNLQSWQQQMQNKASSAAGFGKLAGSLIGGAASSGGWGFLLSDERTKKNVKHVGFTPQGERVYQYEYKKAFQPFTGEGKHLGVMAQELEKTQPEAVVHVGGLKVVDYSKVK